MIVCQDHVQNAFCEVGMYLTFKENNLSQTEIKAPSPLCHLRAIKGSLFESF